jgi:serine/threonine protein kinase/Tol biopolymer transport system component
MTPERWREVERIYQDALDQDPSARLAFLDQACADDPELRGEIMSLLAAHQPDDRFLESGALAVAARDLANEMPALGPGRRLGAYELLTPLGAGGMGEVWKAKDRALHRDVAIKILPPAFARDPDRLRRFEQEARAAAMLAHPNILAVYATGNERGAPYLVAELLEGSTLRDRLSHGPIPEGKAVEYSFEIAQGLAAAHEKGLVHRDLKPENVFVTRDGRVKILDFGLAKLVQSASLVHEPTQTATGVALGTPGYMAPEQVRAQPADHRCDIFAFGVVLYEMLEGRRPFPGESSVETMHAILTQDPPPLTRASPLVEQIVRHCLEKEPSERFQSARDLGFQLRVARHSSSQAAAATALSLPRRPYAAAAAIVLVVASVAATLLWWRPPQEPAPNPTLTITRLTSYAGLTTDAALSPDGTLFAYASDRGGDGNLDIWLQQIGQAEAIRLTTDAADDREPNFSPDGRRIAFRSDRDGGGVYVVSTLGGAATRIVSGGRTPRHSPDGKWVAYWVGLAARVAATGSRVYVIGANGGSPIPIAADLAVARNPVWSPDGTRLLLVGSDEPIYDTSRPSWDWWVAPFEGGMARRTRAAEGLRSQGLGLPTPATWDRERGVLFAADLGDSRNIWQLPLAHDGSPAEAASRLTTAAGIEDGPAVAGGRMAFSSFVENADIWSLPADTLRGTVTGALERVTDNAGLDVQPALSADGRRLAFTSNRAGNFDIYVKDVGSNEERAVTISATFESRPAISADGSMVAYNEGPASNRRVYVSSLRDPAGPVAVNVCEDCYLPWDWSPDKRHLLYWPEKRRQIGLLDVDSRKTAIILAHEKYSLLRAAFSPDGRWVVFQADLAFDRSQMFIAPFRGMSPIDRASWIEVTRAGESGNVARWSPDGNALYAMSNIDGNWCLWRQALDPVTKRPVGEAIAVHHLHGARRSVRYIPPGFAEISVARDRIVFPMAERTGNVWMAEWKY